MPAELPQQAALTSPDHPWPLRLLSAKIKEYIAALSRLWVEGEVITLQRRPGAKVQFLTLRDLEATNSITVKILTFLLPDSVESGSRVVVCAKPDFYEGNGSLSLWADEIRPVGLGDILARLELLKKQLAAEGLFDARRKQPLPFLPHTVGLICGRNTKAKEDVEVNARLRWPAVSFDTREVQVQGGGAVEAMLEALALLDSNPDVDVIVFARGGGSVEDLLPFSDERLVRAAAAAATPIVSAIGHEGDSPILDLVADLRASTPTDAAKHIVPDVAEERAMITECTARIRGALRSRIDQETRDLGSLMARPAFARPETMVDMRENDLASLRQWLHAHMRRSIEFSAAELTNSRAKLRALSPQATLDRGYSILRVGTDGVNGPTNTDATSRDIITTANTVSTGQGIHAILSSGSLDLEVTTVYKGERHG